MFHATETAAAFVDGPNLHATARALGFDIDYHRLMAVLQSEGRLLRASYFTPITASEDDHVAVRPLLDWLQYNGWHVTAKPARDTTDQDGNRRLRGSIDVDLAVAALKLAPAIDHAAIFSGNSAFVPLVARLQDMGLRVTVVSSLKTPTSAFASDDLRRMADSFVDLEDMRHAIARPERASRAA